VAVEIAPKAEMGPESTDCDRRTDVERHLLCQRADAWLTRTGENMNEIEFQSKLAELMTEISTLPVTERKKLEQLADETRQRHERLRATVSSLQESLDYLRLSIKYLVFDLEATRRENGYLRKMLEETSGND
jgi:chromosome segregation ATPase